MYFEDKFPPEYEVSPREELKNIPQLVRPSDITYFPDEKILGPEEFKEFITKTARTIADWLNLKKK